MCHLSMLLLVPGSQRQHRRAAWTQRPPREKTWTAENGVHWLRDLLPEDLPHARILCWGYDVKTHATDRVSWQYLYDHARTLVSDLCRKRKLTNVGALRLLSCAETKMAF